MATLVAARPIGRRCRGPTPGEQGAARLAGDAAGMVESTGAAKALPAVRGSRMEWSSRSMSTGTVREEQGCRHRDLGREEWRRQLGGDLPRAEVLDDAGEGLGHDGLGAALPVGLLRGAMWAIKLRPSYTSSEASSGVPGGTSMAGVVPSPGAKPAGVGPRSPSSSGWVERSPASTSPSRSRARSRSRGRRPAPPPRRWRPFRAGCRCKRPCRGRPAVAWLRLGGR